MRRIRNDIAVWKDRNIEKMSIRKLSKKYKVSCGVIRKRLTRMGEDIANYKKRSIKNGI